MASGEARTEAGGRSPVENESATTQRTAQKLADPRAATVQTLRGLACLLLVSFHVIVDNSVEGIDPNDNSTYQIVAQVFAHLRMPLFIFLSGYAYSYRPVMGIRQFDFIQKKMRRLLLPLLTVTTLFYLFQHASGTVWPGQTLTSIYLYSYAHLWFLQALMLIFAVVFCLELIGAVNTFERFLGVMTGALVLHFLVKVTPNVFSVSQACYLLPFFLAGLGANRFRGQLEQPKVQRVVLMLFVLSMGLHTLACMGLYGSITEQRTLLATVISLSGAQTLINRMPDNQLLQRIGKFSFAIYLFHVFFTASARLSLDAAAVTGHHTYFVVGLTCGIFGPILMERLLRQIPIARRLALGQA